MYELEVTLFEFGADMVPPCKSGAGENYLNLSHVSGKQLKQVAGGFEGLYCQKSDAKVL